MTKRGDEIAKLYKTQISLTEWLANIGHADTVKIRAEDNDKLNRLHAVNSVIGLPYDKPVSFRADELTDQNPRFMKFLKTDGDRQCALRLLPLDPKFPKQRMRGLTVRGAYNWFQKLKINRTKYQADFRAHADEVDWSSIFVVNEHGISGEIIRDRLHNLSQGFYDHARPFVFHYDFHTWTITPCDDEALDEIKRLVNLLYVPEVAKQKQLTKKVADAKFTNNYLFGYFETIDARTVFGLHFDDYSPSLGEIYENFTTKISEEDDSDLRGRVLKGRGASAGIVRGKVRIAYSSDDDFADGEILVAKVTTPDMVGLMQKASAIITDMGGILSHAAIVARELGKPCVVDAGDATTKLHDGEVVEVDGAKGTITVLE